MADEAADRAFDAAEDEYFLHKFYGECRDDCEFCRAEQGERIESKAAVRAKFRRKYEGSRKAGRSGAGSD